KGQGQFTAALGSAREVQALCQRVLGGAHWRTADARRALADLELMAPLPEPGRRAMQSVPALGGRVQDAYRKAPPSEAERLGRGLLAINLRWRGEPPPDAAGSYPNLANALRAQGQHAAAEAMDRKALAIWITALGPDPPRTATSYNNLALSLGA